MTQLQILVRTVIIATFLILPLTFGCAKKSSVPATASFPKKQMEIIGKPASPFHLTTLRGKEVSLADYKGKLLLFYSFHPY